MSKKNPNIVARLLFIYVFISLIFTIWVTTGGS